MRLSAFFVSLLWLFVFGCSSETLVPTNTGELNQACYANSTCNEGLSCVDELCVPTVLPDVVTVDVAPVDVPPTQNDVSADVPDLSDAGPCEGCLGEACSENADCVSGLCLLHMGDNVCSEICVDECPQGWSCRTVQTGSSDSLFACVSNASHLCLPCVTNGDCSSGETQNLCIDYGVMGKFCGSDCEQDADCPGGYICSEVVLEQDNSVNQCMPVNGSCDCSNYAIDMGLTTDCARSNDFGSCAGLRGCSSSGLTECDATEPAFDGCNGLDDDCDGSTDEELGVLSCGVGVCAHETPTCVEGVEQECDPMEGVGEEICDGLDNDCDGATDEDLGSTTCGAGACENTIENCVDGVPVFCNPFEGSSEEVCDGIDNNCDGSTDEGMSSTTCGIGLCLQTVENCVDGEAVTCNPYEGATSETCDGVDNNCDGNTDEDLGSTSCGVGACEQTIDNCVDGTPQFCNPFSGAEAEQCDGVDNDCDGTTDEGLGTTSCGTGACAHESPNCVDGVMQTCNAFEGVAAESCDGIDNDCDGETDEELGSTTCGQGACVHTVENCLSGVAQVCDAFEGVTVESCDAIDNDCDGATDEELGSTTCGEGVCENTIVNCVAGSTQSCDAFLGMMPETCDGLDNDCDGATDEDLGSTACGLGVCANTVDNCTGGVTQVCDAYLGAAAEACDNLDNDCDGATDEELGTTSCGTGVCANTIDSCIDGLSSTCVPGPSSVEICDSLDNNCDGATDEGLAVDGGWSAWSVGSWGSCSTSCGGGTRSRTNTRTCDNPSVSCGGTPCAGAASEAESEACNTQACCNQVSCGSTHYCVNACVIGCGGCNNPGCSYNGWDCSGPGIPQTIWSDCNGNCP